MLEVFIAFMLGVILSWPVFIGLFVFGILFDYSSHRKSTMFLAIVTLLVAYGFFHVPTNMLLMYAIGYLIFGLIWSFYRYRRFLVVNVERNRHIINKELLNGEQTYSGGDRIINSLKPSNNISAITTWIIAWPFSFISNVSRDLILLIETLVKTTFSKIYTMIFNSVVKINPKDKNV